MPLRIIAIYLFRKLSTANRTQFGRGSVEPHLAKALTERNQKLKHLFSVKNLAMKQKPKKSKAVLNVEGLEYKLVGKKLTAKKLTTKGLAGKESAGKESAGKELMGKKTARKKGAENKHDGDMDMENNEAVGGEEKENLDERGYKTIMRPAVSYYKDTR